MATQNSAKRKHATTPPAPFDHGLSCIFRTARTKAARIAKQGRDPEFVAAKQCFDCVLPIRDLSEGGYHLLLPSGGQAFRFSRPRLSLGRTTILILARLCFLLNYIKCASNLGTQLLKLNLQHNSLWINHNVERARESSKILNRRRSHSALNTIAHYRFSQKSPHCNSDPRFPSAS